MIQTILVMSCESKSIFDTPSLPLHRTPTETAGLDRNAQCAAGWSLRHSRQCWRAKAISVNTLSGIGEEPRMSGSSSSSNRRVVTLSAWLREFLHPDVISIVLSYEATINFELHRIYNGFGDSGDGQMNRPQGLLLHADELFVADCGNHRIQVFHQGTGRFLRKWGLHGAKEGEFRFPRAAAVHFSSRHQDLEGKESEIVIIDDYHIHVFRLSDSRFLRRFANESGSWCGGVVVLDDHIFVSRIWPNQIDVRRTCDGTQVRIIGADLGFGRYPGKLLLDDEDQDAKELMVVDPANDRVVALDLESGQCLRQYTLEKDQQNGPQAVAMHGAEVIVCCADSSRLVVLDRSTTRILRVIPGGLMAGTARTTAFASPCDLAINSVHELFVCDTYNHRVLIFQ